MLHITGLGNAHGSFPRYRLILDRAKFGIWPGASWLFLDSNPPDFTDGGAQYLESDDWVQVSVTHAELELLTETSSLLGALKTKVCRSPFITERP
ncbi:hypothetical protein NDU88_002754 [Pleurodeles waltl]|uniref:Uncharacterized protein n=1 Tax=Pleurodeles waltl TaxID=8319 RepID=A0AAV7PCK8_PLEWA|nr:hypothetical protein NDU88_002754 [Pleurodeles waltl]